MVKRWYPFRKVYYEPQNVFEYVKHPMLAWYGWDVRRVNFLG